MDFHPVFILNSANSAYRSFQSADVTLPTTLEPCSAVVNNFELFVIGGINRVYKEMLPQKISFFKNYPFSSN